MSPEEQLRAGAKDLALSLSDRQIEQLIAYLALLVKWNRVYNLTAIRDASGMVTQHLLDSLAIVPHLGPDPLLDVGSGPGLPGLPVAMVRTELPVTLLDSNDKKCAFMRQAIAELGLPNVSVCLYRVEDWEPLQRFGLIVSRAYAELRDFIQSAAHLLAPQGRLLAMKGQYPAEEIARIPTGFKVTGSEKLKVPGMNAERHLIWIAAA
jgi:16S rRNA (guanine527-N7)-methyltransferase